MNRFPRHSAQHSLRQSAQKTAKTAALGKTAFVIENMDPLGQGVFRDNGNIGFIAKTLPGEQGVAQVVKAKKGVKFATLKTLNVISPERIEPECPHFAECPGCHYLHTTYENELAYKKQALQHLLYKLDVDADNIEVLPAPQRLGYRNRLQLHYRKGKIGLIDGLTDSIVEIPHCKILREELQPELDKLYTNNSWQKEHKKDGHCELYLKEEGVEVQWDKDYAHGGFTQVFEAMNGKLCAEVNTFLAAKKPATLLDLFAGNGNLSNAFVADKPTKRVMVDATPHNHPDFVALDLFADGALQTFQKRSQEKAFEVLLLDPPRKGFPELNTWVKTFQPKALVYVSCNPATLARDLQSLEGKFVIEKVQLIDLFPGTYHFETVVFVAYKRHGR